MKQTSNQRVYVVMAKKDHDLKITVRAFEMAVCNAILDETSKMVFMGDVYYGDVRDIVKTVAAKNKIEVADDAFGFCSKDAKNIDICLDKKFIVYKPATESDSVPKQVNEFLDFNRDHLKRRFVHFMRDDVILTGAWNPLMIETMMDDFGYPFYCDPKLSDANKVFGKISPAKTFVYSKRFGDKPEDAVLPYPVVFYTHDDNAYFAFDSEYGKWKDGKEERFDERFRVRYVTEYVYRLCELGVTQAFDYIPDPFVNMTLADNNLFKKRTEDDQKKAIEDLQNDIPLIDELNKKRQENDFERWDDVLKNLTDTCDRIEKHMVGYSAK